VITPDVIASSVGNVPDELLSDSVTSGEFTTTAAARKRYVAYLTTRIRSPRDFVTEATDARARVHRTAPVRVAARR
jgi:hypothetical protein